MKCPICNNDEQEKIFCLCDNMKILGPSFPAEKAYISVCDKCGLVYLDTEASQENYISYYKSGAIAPKYYEMFGMEETEHYYEHIYQTLKPYIIEDSKILDVAGSWGELASYLSDRGMKSIMVIDTNENCVKSSKDRGLSSVVCSSLNMNQILDDKYDLVILNHTLEHILDVETTMKNIDHLLSDEGYLFIEVPDATSYIKENSAPFNFLTYEHVLHLSENDLNNIAALYGYDVIQMESYYKKVSNYPSIFAIMKKSELKKKISFSKENRALMKGYIDKSKKTMETFINPLQETFEPIILWGIGASTASLVNLFDMCNVVALVDSNPSRQGLSFEVAGKDLLIQNPEVVEDGTIVILSIPYHASIKKQIRGMGLQNKIVALGGE